MEEVIGFVENESSACDKKQIDCCKVLRLWLLDFLVKGVGKGCAVVKADNPAEAIAVLTSSGSYNGEPQKYDIQRVEQIIEPPYKGLVAEDIVSYNMD